MFSAPEMLLQVFKKPLKDSSQTKCVFNGYLIAYIKRSKKKKKKKHTCRMLYWVGAWKLEAYCVWFMKSTGIISAQQVALRHKL